MATPQRVTSSQPTSIRPGPGDRAFRISCDSCRAKKVRCSGERPTCTRCLDTNLDCCYSPRMSLGRPKARRSHQESRRIRQRGQRAASRPRSTSPGGSLPHADMSPIIGGDIATHQSHQFTPLEGLRTDLESGLACLPPINGSNRNDDSSPERFYPQPERGMPSIPADRCACLSEQYLLLEQLRVKSRLIAPDDLVTLRGSIQKAVEILNCQECPSRYFSVIQNSVILGVVCMCIGECYARILDTIDAEEARLVRNDERKRVRISNIGDGIPCYLNPPDDTFSAKVTPAVWRSLMRDIVKAEIYGVDDSAMCFMKLVRLLELRQTRWHQEPPAFDCPPSYRSTCQVPDRIPTCLLIAGDVRKLIDCLAL